MTYPTPPSQPFGSPPGYGGSYGGGGPYGYVPTKTSGMAIWSMVLGIAGVIICGFGVPFSLVALILGIIAMAKINRQPMQVGGRGYAMTGIILGTCGFAGVVVIALLIGILTPSLGRARELSNRGYCSANLRGIMQSCNIYAADNADTFPVISRRSDITARGARYDAASTLGTPNSNANNTMESLYSTGSPAGAPVYQNLWMLVLENQVSPKQFICKSDPAAGAVAAPQTFGGNYAVTFTSNGTTVDLSRVSYSVAYMYNNKGEVGGWWKSVTDPTLPLISDMAPLNGEGSRGVTINVTSLTGSPKTYNSRNHGGDGQVVGYSDVHAMFERRPDVGANSDNIWTSGGTSGGTPSGIPITMPGTITPIGTETSPWDTIMVPVRNSSGVTQ